MRYFFTAVAFSSMYWLTACLLSPYAKDLLKVAGSDEAVHGALSYAQEQATYLRYKGDLRGAIASLSRVLAIRKQIPQVATHVMKSKKSVSSWNEMLVERGELYILTGQYQEALDDFKMAIGHGRRISGVVGTDPVPGAPDHELRERVHMAIVRIFLSTGAHDAALLLLEELRSDCHTDCSADLLAALGLTHFHKTAYSSARGYTEAALKKLEKDAARGLIERETDLRIADALIVLARLDVIAGRILSAEARLTRAASLYRLWLGQSHPAWASLYESQAGWYHARGIHGQDEHLMQRALSLRSGTQGVTHADTLQAQVALAQLHMDRHAWERARAVAREASKHLEISKYPNQLIYCKVLDQLAKLNVRAGRLHEALTSWQHCLVLLIPSPGRLLPFGHDARARFEYSLEMLSHAISLQMHGGLPADTESVMSMISHSKNWVSDQILGTFTQLKASSMGGSPKREQSAYAGKLLQELSRLVSTLSTRLHDLQASGRATKRQLEELRLSIQEVEGSMLLWASMGWELKEDWGLGASVGWESGLAVSIGAQLQGSDWLKIAKRVLTGIREESSEPKRLVNMAAIRHRLVPGQALLEIFRYQPNDLVSPEHNVPRYGGYLLQPGRPVEAIDLGDSATIESLVTQLRVALSQRRDDVREIGRRLDERVMTPVRKALQDAPVTTLFVAPDGYLHLLPFQALVDADGRYLIENQNFVYINSGRDLLNARIEIPTRNAPVVIANPAFGLQDVSISQLDAAADRARPFYFEPLPGTAREAEDLRELLPGATIWTDVEASETNLKGVQGPQVLHLATHGIFQPPVLGNMEQRSRLPLGLGLLAPDPLMRSALAFARANEPAQELHDGIVTALEAALLDLEGTELVVLSGCETGIGDVAHGEAVYGLRQAIMLAGARSMVMSLWRVHDEATRHFMRAFYQRLRAGESRENALRDTQLEFVRDEMYSHPSYWGAFVLAGQTGPIAL